MKVAGAWLEDFVDWTGIISSELVEEEEMFRFASGFVAQMCLRAAGSEGETTPITDGKCSKLSSLDEEA